MAVTVLVNQLLTVVFTVLTTVGDIGLYCMYALSGGHMVVHISSDMDALVLLPMSCTHVRITCVRTMERRDGVAAIRGEQRQTCTCCAACSKSETKLHTYLVNKLLYVQHNSSAVGTNRYTYV